MQDVKCGTVHTLFLPVCFESENIWRERIKPLQQGEKENYNF